MLMDDLNEFNLIVKNISEESDGISSYFLAKKIGKSEQWTRHVLRKYADYGFLVKKGSKFLVSGDVFTTNGFMILPQKGTHNLIFYGCEYYGNGCACGNGVGRVDDKCRKLREIPKEFREKLVL